MGRRYPRHITRAPPKPQSFPLADSALIGSLRPGTSVTIIKTLPVSVALFDCIWAHFAARGCEQAVGARAPLQIARKPSNVSNCGYTDHVVEILLTETGAVTVRLVSLRWLTEVYCNSDTREHNQSFP